MTPIRPLRVLFVCHSASRNGATILLLQLIRWLKPQGEWEIHVLIHGDGALAEDFAAVATTTIWRDPSTALDALFRRKGEALRTFVEHAVGRTQLPARRFDLIYANTVAVLPSVRLLARKGCPILWHVHELEYAIRMLSSETEWRAVVGAATRFVAVSQAVKRMLHDTFGVPARSIDVAAGFSPLRAVPPDERRRRRSQVLTRLGWPEDAFVVGGCGIPGWRKGTDLFLQIAKKVVDGADLRDFRFLWVGGVQGSREWLEFQHDLRKLNLQGRVQLVADSSEVADHYCSMSAFALTSREDPFPLVALEAAEYHVPVLCFDGAGGTMDFVAHDAGISVPYLDIERFASELIDLHDHADRCERLTQVAYQKVHATYCVEVQGPKIVETMRACVADPPAVAWAQ
ncbi:glycosyltransferase family 4 protein [Methylibium sp.]|uniref:glycosyltransferase family 4 protein n=1 Tax=Methylibium sp. TaxID=2067992 RepID=UPI0017938C2F|nr:glycosyltransferase family 4 protein [Methylibium sp.]MBA3589299.1 glycosyltransferase family 4 protein [Methylibium sp.]